MLKTQKTPPSPIKMIAVLGIGTELTSGQILNRNGQWISGKMKDFGVQTACHVVVPDDRKLILEALDFCYAHSDILFVTGGLGPTSDDFTREVIAKWTNRELVFDQSSWEHINQRLSARNIVVREDQRQQCFYPADSTILHNRNGTANAFVTKHFEKEVYVLPGPPFEIATVWDDFIAGRMAAFTAGIDRYLTASWDCIGVGESEISHSAERVLSTCPEKIEKAYRVHLPYVEFKVSYYQSQQPKIAPWLEQLDKALAPYWVLKNGEDICKTVEQKMSQFQNVVVIDTLTGAVLTQRLMPFAKSLLKNQRIQFCSEEHPISAGTNTLCLRLEKGEDSRAKVSIEQDAKLISEELISTYSSEQMKERGLQYFAEMALLFWARNIR